MGVMDFEQAGKVAERVIADAVPAERPVSSEERSDYICYKRGFEAGLRQRQLNFIALRERAEHAEEQWRMWRNKAQGFEHAHEAGQKQEPINLDRMRFESLAQADRAATKALLEQEPWHADLDPDEV
jgi:hypothetical protein